MQRYNKIPRTANFSAFFYMVMLTANIVPNLHIYMGVAETIFKGWIWLAPYFGCMGLQSLPYSVLFPMMCPYPCSSFLTTKIQQFFDICKFFCIKKIPFPNLDWGFSCTMPALFCQWGREDSENFAPCVKLKGLVNLHIVRQGYDFQIFFLISLIFYH